MGGGFISRGFRGRRRRTEGDVQIPPGQYLVDGFPVLSAGPTPRTPLAEWDFTIAGEFDGSRTWSSADWKETSGWVTFGRSGTTAFHIRVTW